MLRPLPVLLLLACGLVVLAVAIVAARTPAEPAGRPPAGAGRSATVQRVGDGDTIRLADGGRVRLVQIDAPELGEGECFAREARDELARLLPPGTRVRLETDERLDEVDRFGRVLAYVFREDENVNRTLVLRGAASAWFRGGVRGRYAGELERAAQSARAAGRGLWGACPEASYDLRRSVETGRAR